MSPSRQPTPGPAPAPHPPRRGIRFWSALVAIGLLGGLLSGMFGIGGGIIMVPLLVSLAGMDQRRAAATSLTAIVPTSIAGSLAYFSSGQIDAAAGIIVAVGAVGGALIGTMLLRRIPLVWLRWMFIALIVGVAVRMLLVVPVRGEHLDLSPPLTAAYLALGLVMGIASGLFGIGGGVIAVPALVTLFGMSDLIAKGTSLLVMIPTGITGTISNARARMVDVRAGLAVGAAATVASIPGVAIALVLSPRVSGILFALLLAVAAVQLGIKAVRTPSARSAAKITPVGAEDID